LKAHGEVILLVTQCTAARAKVQEDQDGRGVEKGARRFAWIKPGEQLPDLPFPPPAGAFAYLLETDAIYFPVVDEY